MLGTSCSKVVRLQFVDVLAPVKPLWWDPLIGGFFIYLLFFWCVWGGALLKKKQKNNKTVLFSATVHSSFFVTLALGVFLLFLRQGIFFQDSSQLN